MAREGRVARQHACGTAMAERAAAPRPRTRTWPRRMALLGLVLLVGGCQAMSQPEADDVPGGSGEGAPHVSVGGTFGSMVGVVR